MARQPFDDVTVADVLNLLHARHDVSQSQVARRNYATLIEELLRLGDAVRENRACSLNWASTEMGDGR